MVNARRTFPPMPVFRLSCIPYAPFPFAAGSVSTLRVSHMESIMITAIIKEMAEPKFQSPLVKNCVSMTLPTSTYCPPPRSFGIKKLDTAGRNTSVIPLSTPGRERGSVTFRKLCMGVAPRSLAASSRLLSIFAREE